MRRRFRKGLRVQWVPRAADLPQAWQALLPPAHFLQPASLQVYEDAQLPDVGFGYALVWAGSEPVAAASFQTLRIRSEHLNPAPLRSWQRAAWQTFARAARPVLLVSGHLFRHDAPAFFAAPELAPFDAFRVYHTAVREAARQTCAAAVLLKDPPEALHIYLQQFAPEFLLLRADVSMELAIRPEWDNFTVYEKALKHKYAQRVRNVRKAAAGLAIRELDAAEVAARQHELHALYRQVTDRQPVRLGFLSPALLPLLKAAQPDALKVWGFFEGETLVAFASAWLKEAALDMFYIGFDYASNQRLQLYFNILFFAVEQAIAARKKTLILGRTALEAKARLGCTPRYLQTFLYIRNPLLGAWVARTQRRLSSGEGEWESRHPFKDAS